jgi:4-amino-4-deoxy-L-arabinose transferase-like glycosyltransferase
MMLSFHPPSGSQSRPRDSDLIDGALVLVLAMMVRVVFCFVIYPHLPDFGPGDGYDLIALNITRGNGYMFHGLPAAAERLPLYPLLLAAGYLVFGPQSWPWQLAQCACSAATCVLVLRMARDYATRSAALAAAIVCALHPTLIFYTARPFTETLYTYLLLLFVRAVSRPSWRPRSVGCLLGLQLLTKSTAFLHLVAFIPSLRRVRVRTLAGVAVWASVGLLPWVGWNLWCYGQPHLFAARYGITLYHGLYISRAVSWTVPAADLNRDAELALWKELQAAGISPHADIVVRDRFAGRAARTWIARHPYESGKLWLRNLVLTWYLGRSRLSMVGYVFLHGVLLAAAALGAVRLRAAPAVQTRDLATVAALLIVAYTVFYAATQPAVRYILPAVPLVALLAAGVTAHWDQRR